MGGTKLPNKIIFDTDIGGDCDDAGALALLHKLCDMGECELLAVTACYEIPYVAGCIDSINRYYNRTVPIGILYGKQNPSSKPFGTYAKELCENFENSYPAENYKCVPDTLTVLRRTLANQEDKSVTLVATGTMSSLAALVESQGDDISPLSGRELIIKKIKRTVVMGGRFCGTWPMPIDMGNNFTIKGEFNIRKDVKAAQIVCAKWPTELVFSSFEIGLWCVSMKGYAQNAPKDNPVRMAYDLYPPARENGRESWDQTAMLYAIRPDAGYWNLHPHGRIKVDDDGATNWVYEKGGMQTYLIPREDYCTIREVIDQLVS